MSGIYDDSHVPDSWRSPGGSTEGRESSPADKEGDRGSRAMSKLGMIGEGEAFACGGEFSKMKVES